MVNDLADAHHWDRWIVAAGSQGGLLECRGIRLVDVAEHGHGRESCQHGKVDGGFGMAQPSQHAALARPNWRHRPGRAEVGTVAIGCQGSNYCDCGLVVRSRRSVGQPHGGGQRRTPSQRVAWFQRLFRQSEIVEPPSGARRVDIPVAQVSQTPQRFSPQVLASRHQVKVRTRQSVIDHGHDAAAPDAVNGGYHRVGGHRVSSSL